MTQTWEFVLPNGSKMYTTLAWKYVPYIEELQAWVLENWDVRDHPFGGIIEWGEAYQDPAQIEKENWCRFYKEADRLLAIGTKPKHPIGWALDKVKEHMDGDVSLRIRSR